MATLQPLFDVRLRVDVGQWEWRFIDITYGLWSETCGIVHWLAQTH